MTSGLRIRIRTGLLGLIGLSLAACSTTAPPTQRDRMVPVPVNEASGYLPTQITFSPDEVRIQKADVLIREKTLLVPDSQLIVIEGEDYFVQQLRMLNLFAEVISIDQLRQRIAQRDLTDEVGDLKGVASAKKAYELYRPYLLLTTSVLFDEALKRPTLQMEILDPGDEFNAVFSARTITSMFGSGSDQKVRRPLFNSLIDWVQLSKKFSKETAQKAEGRANEN